MTTKEIKYYIYNNATYVDSIDVIPENSTEITKNQYDEIIDTINNSDNVLVTDDEQGTYHFEIPILEDRESLIKKCDEIVDKDTDSKILTGYEYNNCYFYLSLENQNNYNVEVSLRQNLTYPHKIKCIGGYYMVESAEDYYSMYMGAIQYIRSLLEDGWDKKDVFPQLTNQQLYEYIKTGEPIKPIISED